MCIHLRGTKYSDFIFQNLAKMVAQKLQHFCRKIPVSIGGGEKKKETGGIFLSLGTAMPKHSRVLE